MTDTPDAIPAAFGYQPRDLHRVHSVQVAEGKDPQTLQPFVAISFRSQRDPEHQIGFALPLDLAQPLSDELARWAQRARERHYDPPHAN